MANVEVDGLASLVRGLRGPLFKDLNRELRASARLVASDMVPMVADAVRRSNAPQAAAMAGTVRVHSDRVPVVVLGKVNPRFRSHKWRGADSRRRRGAMALGVVRGPMGGKRSTAVHENYYKIGHDDSWGPLGKAIRGPIMRQGEIAYLKLYIAALRAHGFNARP